ncbi:hypothetical protein CAPTEDRAFT_219488 [Capitella teleta]|uniref:SUEL-type lectin domain-containing protein n=1 Tax=Capitella teleta TaxID=283909 RepID=X2APM6_CAPTE|nr:hypothetical protein CAPTEDRAFT_219488 [Capitella teleta]|eukprot:ELU10135.1 hypothetical protein CAPTEDRAFT_219488 [Capitella teleta]
MVDMLSNISRACCAKNSSGSNEYCENEAFRAECSEGEVIVITSAVYGRMRVGKCVTELFDHMPCQVDVLRHMDSWCSGRRNCDVLVTSLVHDAPQPCPKDYRSYLQAEYRCMPGKQLIKSERVHMHGKADGCYQPQKVDLSNGNIASVVTMDTNCGSIDAPWVIQVPKGMRIEFTLLDFSLLDLQVNDGRPKEGSDVCLVYAIIKEEHIPTKTVCGAGDREGIVHTSARSRVEVRLVSKRNKEEDDLHYLLKYRAIGCMNPSLPDNAWLQRTSGDNAIIRCNASDAVWRLRCTNGKWDGTTGSCPPIAGPNGDRALVGRSQMPGGISIAIIVGVAMCVGLVILFVGIMCLRKHRKRRNVPRYGAAAPYSTSQSTAPPPCKHLPSDNTDFYDSSEHRYYPTWHHQGNERLGNAMPPVSLTDAGLSDPERKSSHYHTDHIYESPQFERREYSFAPTENNMDHAKYFELDPRVANNNAAGSKNTSSFQPKNFTNRYST